MLWMFEFKPQVARKAGPDGKMTLSMGFGFIEVDREEIAKVSHMNPLSTTLSPHEDLPPASMIYSQNGPIEDPPHFSL